MSTAKLLKIEGDATPEEEETGVVLLVDQGNAMIADLPEEPLNLLTVVGPALSGKSSLMNILARDQGLFGVLDESESCTCADISPKVMTIADFVDAAELEDSSSSPAIAFVHVEGHSDAYPLHEGMLATPIILVSKVVMFNWVSFPNSTMMDRLGMMAKAAAFIDDDQRVDALGHLVILLRNLGDQEGEAEAFIFEREDPHEAATLVEIEAIISRNKTRDILEKSFESVRVFCMPDPHEDGAEGILDPEELHPDFRAKVDELRGLLAGLLGDANKFAGEDIKGGEMLPSLLSDICERMNVKADAISPVSTLDSMHERQADEVYEMCEAFLFHATKDFQGGRLKSGDDEDALLEDVRASTIDNFDQLSESLPEELVVRTKEKLEQTISDRFSACRHLKTVSRDLVHAEVSKLISDARLRVAEQALKVQDDLPLAEDGELLQVWKDECDRIRSTLDDEIAGVLPEGASIDSVPSVPAEMEELESIMEEHETNLVNMNERMIAGESDEEQMEALERMKDRQRNTVEEEGRRNAQAEEDREEQRRERDRQSSMFDQQTKIFEAKLVDWLADHQSSYITVGLLSASATAAYFRQRRLAKFLAKLVAKSAAQSAAQSAYSSFQNLFGFKRDVDLEGAEDGEDDEEC